MEHPGDIIITAIIITGRLPGHRITGRRLTGRRRGRLPDLQADHPADRLDRHRCLQEVKIEVILYRYLKELSDVLNILGLFSRLKVSGS